ncbi:MAG: hypothetical protein ABI675_15005 [Chitinophagaceae bacterium]
MKQRGVRRTKNSITPLLKNKLFLAFKILSDVSEEIDRREILQECGYQQPVVSYLN